MTVVQPVNSSAARVALDLHMRRTELVAAYQDHLQRMNSSLLDESATLSQVTAHVVETLDEIIGSLRGDTQAAHRSVLARSIGASRAASGVHPAESLQASMAAFDVFMVAVAESLNVTEDSAMLSAALIINQVIMSRIESAVSRRRGSTRSSAAGSSAAGSGVARFGSVVGSVVGGGVGGRAAAGARSAGVGVDGVEVDVVGGVVMGAAVGTAGFGAAGTAVIGSAAVGGASPITGSTGSPGSAANPMPGPVPGSGRLGRGSAGGSSACG